jgi:hypothetical protein
MDVLLVWITYNREGFIDPFFQKYCANWQLQMNLDTFTMYKDILEQLLKQEMQQDLRFSNDETDDYLMSSLSSGKFLFSLIVDKKNNLATEIDPKEILLKIKEAYMNEFGEEDPLTHSSDHYEAFHKNIDRILNPNLTNILDKYLTRPDIKDIFFIDLNDFYSNRSLFFTDNQIKSFAALLYVLPPKGLIEAHLFHEHSNYLFIKEGTTVCGIEATKDANFAQLISHFKELRKSLKELNT